MKATPSSPSAPGATTTATTAAGSQMATAAAENSHTNAAPPLAVFASTFHAAWASAATRTRARAAVGTEGLLSDGPQTRAGRKLPPGFCPFRSGPPPRRGPSCRRLVAAPPVLILDGPRETAAGTGGGGTLGATTCCLRP